MFRDCRRVYWSPQLLNPKNFKVFPVCRLGIRRLNSWGPGKGSISQKTSKPKFDGKLILFSLLVQTRNFLQVRQQIQWESYLGRSERFQNFCHCSGNSKFGCLLSRHILSCCECHDELFRFLELIV